MEAITEEKFNLYFKNLNFTNLLNEYKLNDEQVKKVVKAIKTMSNDDKDIITYKILIKQKVSIDNIELIIKYFSNIINWNILLMSQNLSETFIEKYKDKLDLNYVSIYQVLSEAFIEKYKDKINWGNVSQYQNLSESFIEKYFNKLDLYSILLKQKLSESFIEKHIDRFNNYDLLQIVKYQKLSESFIEKHFNILPINYVLKYQILSESFFEKHIEIFNSMNNKDNIMFYQNYSNEFAEKHNLLKSFVTNRESYNRMTRVIKANKKFECYNDYFIAYKAIRPDRYSFFNFQYQYLPNNVYESKCDCTSENNSFGLSIGTYEFAKYYLSDRNGIIVKCKVYYKDIGRIAHDGNKVRCFKIEILD